MTRAYWYSVSRSQITRASPVALTVPTGMASRSATPTGARTKRRCRAGTATTASASAKARNVRRVPTSGMSRSALRNVPTSEPMVEIAYRRPATRPASSTVRTLRRTA